MYKNIFSWYIWEIRCESGGVPNFWGALLPLVYSNAGQPPLYLQLCRHDRICGAIPYIFRWRLYRLYSTTATHTSTHLSTNPTIVCNLLVLFHRSRLLSSTKHLIKTKMCSRDGRADVCMCVCECRGTMCIFVLSRTYRWSSGACRGKTKRLKLIVTISSRRHDSVRLSECAELLSAQLVWEMRWHVRSRCTKSYWNLLCRNAQTTHSAVCLVEVDSRVVSIETISYKEQFGRHAAATLPHRHQIQMRTERETNYYNNKWSHARCATHYTDLSDARARGVGGSVEGPPLIRQYAYWVWKSVSNRTMFRIEMQINN